MILSLAKMILHHRATSFSKLHCNRIFVIRAISEARVEPSYVDMRQEEIIRHGVGGWWGRGVSRNLKNVCGREQFHWGRLRRAGFQMSASAVQKNL